MVVHIGVVFIAVGLTAATAFGQRGTLVLAHGESGTFAGHTVEFVGTRVVRTPSNISQQALLRIDGGAVFTPAISQFGTGTQAVGTPAIDSSVTSDVYLTINSIPAKGGSWTFGVVVQPLVMWLWVGGALIVVGSILSAVPGRRRRPTDPVSAPLGAVAPPVVPEPELAPAPEREPVGAGEAP
jgi:cytochrome c-type biogenesis protein CcmF